MKLRNISEKILWDLWHGVRRNIDKILSNEEIYRIDSGIRITAMRTVRTISCCMRDTMELKSGRKTKDLMPGVW